MHAILMAAGIGSRLSKQPTCPKCLWELNGEPLIVHTVRMLTNAGIGVSMVVGFKHEMIREALKDFNVTYYYNPFYRATNSMGSLWFAENELDGKEDLLLGNADVFFEEGLLNRLKTASAPAMMLGDKTRCESGDYFFTLKDGHIVDYGKHVPLEKRSCEYVGLCHLQKEFVPGFKERLDKLISEEKYDLWWENVLYNSCEEYPVEVLDVEDNFWGEIDYLQDYYRIANYVSEKNK